MSDQDGSFEPVVHRLVKGIEELEAQVTQKKRLVNEICREYGQPPRFADVDAPKTSAISARGRDVFYGRPLATVMREFLELRGPSARGGLGAATVNEIYDALVGGGFKFDARDETNAKRGLRIALSKNTATFHKVGNAYGLSEWYPAASRAAQRAAEKAARAGDEQSDDPFTDEIDSDGEASVA
jgi:hypothetical protein